MQLQTRGFRQTPEVGRTKIPDTPEVLITAHGISDVERRRLESHGKRLIDTTCPLVRRVHRAAKTFQAAGYQVLLIGRPGHVEVQGIVEDVADCRVLASAQDVTSYLEKKLGIVCQTRFLQLKVILARKSFVFGNWDGVGAIFWCHTS